MISILFLAFAASICTAAQTTQIPIWWVSPIIIPGAPLAGSVITANPTKTVLSMGCDPHPPASLTQFTTFGCHPLTVTNGPSTWQVSYTVTAPHGQTTVAAIDCDILESTKAVCSSEGSQMPKQSSASTLYTFSGLAVTTTAVPITAGVENLSGGSSTSSGLAPLITAAPGGLIVAAGAAVAAVVL